MRVFSTKEWLAEDYPEDDYPDGKGVYYCTCHKCKCEFFGYKGRFVCKPCYEKHKAKLAAMTPEELEQYNKEQWEKMVKAVKSVKI